MNKYLIGYNAIKVRSLDSVKGLYKREVIVMMLVIGLFERNKGTLSKFDLITHNKATKATTYAILASLEVKGFITSKKESNHFFAKSYISLTEKGLTFKRELSKLLNTPIC